MTDELATVADLLTGVDFQQALALSGVASGLLVIVSILSRTRPLPVLDALLVVAGSAVIVLVMRGEADGFVLAAMAIHGGAAVAATRSTSGGVAIGLLGTWLLLTQGNIADEAWIQVVLFAGIPTLAIALHRFFASVGPRAWTIAIGASLVGVWATLPDTDLVRILIGAALPGLLLTWPARLVPIRALGSGMFAALVGLLILNGGRGRGGSVVGAWGSFLIPVFVTWLLWREPDAQVPESRRAGLVFVHVAVAFWASRVAGFQESGLRAVLLVSPAAVIALVATIWAVYPIRHHHPDDG